MSSFQHQEALLGGNKSNSNNSSSSNVDLSYRELQQGLSWLDSTSPHSGSNASISPMSSRKSFPCGVATSPSANTSTPVGPMFQGLMSATSGAGAGIESGEHLMRAPNDRPHSWSGVEVDAIDDELAVPRKSSAFHRFFRIAILSVSQEQDVDGSFFAYNICITTRFSKTDVRRRYRHFMQLHQDLSQQLRDEVRIPRLPMKRRTSSAMEVYTHDDMRVSLQKYLQILGSMHQVWHCSSFLNFLDYSHPILGLQVQFTSLTDDISYLREENTLLSRHFRNMSAALDNATATINKLQHQVSILEHHIPNPVPTSTSPHSGNCRSYHLDNDLLKGVRKHLQQGDKSPLSVLPNVRGLDGVVSQTNIDCGPDEGVSYSRASIRLNGPISSVSNQKLIASEDNKVSIPLANQSIAEESSSEAVDEDAFYNFFGLEKSASETEATLQQLAIKTSHGEKSSDQPEKTREIPSLINAAGVEHISSFLPIDVINKSLSNSALLDFSNHVVSMLLPDNEQLQLRFNIEKYVSKLVRKSLGAQMFQTGLYSLRCFLPGDPVCLSVYLCCGLENSWYIRLNEKLSRMSSGSASSSGNQTNDDDAEDDENENDGENAGGTKSAEVIKGDIETSSKTQGDEVNQSNETSTTHNHPIKSVSVLGENVDSMLQCVIGSCTVNIRANVKTDLCFAAFLEEVDQSVGRNHLFKKSLTLVRAWWTYESPKYAKDAFNTNFVPEIALCIMVCAVFNLYPNDITSPAHVLMLFLAEFSDFDWKVYALTIFGRVRRNLIKAFPYSTFIKKNGRLFSAPIIQRYQKVLHGTAPDMLDGEVGFQQSEDNSPPKSAIFTLFERIDEGDNGQSTSENTECAGSNEIKIFHPLEPNVNVVSDDMLPGSVELFLEVMQGGASAMRDMLQQMSENAHQSVQLKDFFSNTLLRCDQMRQSMEESRLDDSEVDGGVLKKQSDVLLGGADSDAEFAAEMGQDPLYVPIARIVEMIKHCNFLLEAQVTEPALQRLSKDILNERGPLPVGEIGKMLQEITSISTLSAFLKEKYGGLKKFLELFEEDFVISTDHPFNPHVFLRRTLTNDEIYSIVNGTIPAHLSSKANKRRLSRRKRLSSQGSAGNDRVASGVYERSGSMSNQERTNSYNSYSSQQSFGHTTNSSRSPTPSSFYGFNGASSSHSPPDSQVSNLLHHDRRHIEQDDSLDAYRRSFPGRCGVRLDRGDASMEYNEDVRTNWRRSDPRGGPPGLYAVKGNSAWGAL